MRRIVANRRAVFEPARPEARDLPPTGWAISPTAEAPSGVPFSGLESSFYAARAGGGRTMGRNRSALVAGKLASDAGDTFPFQFSPPGSHGLPRSPVQGNPS